MHDFEKLLSRHIGLDGGSVGHELIARAVQEGQKRAGLADAGAYFELVTGSSAELQALIEAVVVVETWFFREPEAFAALTRELCIPWLAAHPSGVLRLLSLPCATGEEPYSMAMALSDVGFPPRRFAIDGIDISERALARAREGIYGNNAFRSKDASFRDRHFEPVARGFRLREELRAAVSFRAGNLLSVTDSLEEGRYQAVFCRNVLIYLDREAQQRAFDVLHRLLIPGGLLFVGPSETSLVPAGEFSPMKIPLAFAFRKATAAEPRRRPCPPAPLRAGSPASDARLVPPPALTPAGPRRAIRSSSSQRARPPPTITAATRASGEGALTAAVERARGANAGAQAAPAFVGSGTRDRDAHLEQVVSLADRGQLSEASRLCSEHERLHGPSARLYHLMGLLSEAASELDDAAAFHKKALYLDPNHEEALTHLAFLLDKRGDAAGADRLRQRARRLAAKAGP